MVLRALRGNRVYQSDPRRAQASPDRHPPSRPHHVPYFTRTSKRQKIRDAPLDNQLSISAGAGRWCRSNGGLEGEVEGFTGTGTHVDAQALGWAGWLSEEMRCWHLSARSVRPAGRLCGEMPSRAYREAQPFRNPPRLCPCAGISCAGAQPLPGSERLCPYACSGPTGGLDGRAIPPPTPLSDAFDSRRQTHQPRTPRRDPRTTRQAAPRTTPSGCPENDGVRTAPCRTRGGGRGKRAAAHINEQNARDITRRTGRGECSSIMATARYGRPGTIHGLPTITAA
jgi:hypothetical protein